MKIINDPGFKDMKQKTKLFAKRVNVLVGLLVIVVLGGAALLSTNYGQNLTGIKINPFASQANSKFKQARNPVKDSYLVILQPSTDSVGEASRLTGKFGGQSKRIYKAALKGFSMQATEAQALALSDDPAVQFVEEDGYAQTSATETSAPWNLDRLDQHPLPLDTTYTYNATGAGVNAYIIDTGIRTSHTEFSGRASVSFDAGSDGKNGQDCNGHGTHVAGTVGSNTYGVAKQVYLHAVRVATDCTGSIQISALVSGIDWVTANHQSPAVANISIGISGISPGTDLAIKNMIASGVTTAVAAGNQNMDACLFSPSDITEAIVVGATDASDTKASFSDIGSCVDTFAPGVGILSTNYLSDTATATLSGTSMASPHVAGAAALYLQSHPTASPAEVEASIISSATTNLVNNPGAGSPNRLLYDLAFTEGTITPPPTSSDTTPPVVNISAPTAGSTIKGKNLNVSASASDASGIASISISFDGSVVKTCSNATNCSASINVNKALRGTHTITVMATDKASPANQGSKTESVIK